MDILSSLVIAKNLGMLLVGIWLENLESHCVFQRPPSAISGMQSYSICEPLQAQLDTGS
jgi:hypothetical protein